MVGAAGQLLGPSMGGFPAIQVTAQLSRGGQDQGSIPFGIPVPFLANGVLPRGVRARPGRRGHHGRHDAGARYRPCAVRQRRPPTPSDNRGRFFAVWRLLAQAAPLAAPAAFAFLAEHVSYGVGFLYLAACASLVVLGVTRVLGNTMARADQVERAKALILGLVSEPGGLEYVRTLDDLAGLNLRRPYALLAFGGWIDASWAATNAVRYLVDRLAAPRIAELDPEPFYSFTDTRPRVLVRNAGERNVRWRQGRWHAARMGDEVEHDLVLFIAPEPNLRWRTFTRVVLDFFEQLGTEAVLTVGSVLAPAHHRANVPLRGWATTDEWRSALRQRGVRRSSYEGPTGISTILSVDARERGLAALSLSASTPNYLGNSANPRTSLALLRAVSDLFGIRLPLVDLERGVRAYNEQVDQLLANQPELRAEIDRLAQSAGDAEPEADPEPDVPTGDPDRPPRTGELPGGAEVVRELEDFLKELRKSQDEGSADT